MTPALAPLKRAPVRAVLAAAAAVVALRVLWPAPAGVVVQGAIVGALTAMIAFGIALVYRSNRVINFAQADLGSVPVALAVSLMTFKGLSYWAALPLAIVVAAGLGWLVERLVIRRFAHAPRLVLTVVTIGIAQVLAGLASAIPFLVGGKLPPPCAHGQPFNVSFTLSPVIFHANDLIAVVFVLGASVGLSALLKRTPIGLSIRASAESSDRAGLLGINVARTQSVVWVVATVLAGTATWLRAGVLGVPFGEAFGPELMLRALAAAVIGRMERFGTIFVAAVGLGIVETSILFSDGTNKLTGPVMFVVILVALLLQRRDRESRVEDQAISSWASIDRLRPVPYELAVLPIVRWTKWVLGVVGLLLLVALPQVLSIGRVNLASAMFLYGILAVALVIQVGWAGEISLGHVGFLAIGAAVSGALNAHLHLDLVVTTLVAGLVGGVAALIVGLPALRIRGIFLAVTSLAFAVLASSYLLDKDRFGYLPDDITEPIVRFPLLGRVEIVSEHAFYYVCLGALCVALWLASGLRGRFERIVVSVRDNERAAEALGIDPARTKLQAFVASGFLASFAGGLLAIHQRAIGEQIFAPVESLRALSMVVVGGIGSIPGALLGTLFVKATEWLDFLVPSQYTFLFRFVGSGAGLVLVLMIFPSGLASIGYRLRDRFLGRVAARHGIDSPFRTSAADGAGAPIAARSEPGPVSDALLSVRRLDVAYGQVQVLFGVDLDVYAGEIVALLGTNGAGKSTVLRAVCGLTETRSGSVWFDGREITSQAPHHIAAAGISQVPGGRAIFPSLTVDEHLRLASRIRDASERERGVAEVYGLFPILAEKVAQPAALLSGGQQQMLGLGMAFVAAPKLLVIDELSLGLAPVVVDQLLDLVRELRDRGTTIVVVEQSVNIALTIADRAYFLEKGEVRFEGPTADLLDRPDVLRSVYLEGAAAGSGTSPGRRRAT